MAPERVYTASYNERARHVHFFLLPRTRALPAGHVVSDLFRRARGILRGWHVRAQPVRAGTRRRRGTDSRRRRVAAAPRVRFSALWRRLGAAGDGADVFERLTAAYAEEGRAYHTMEHVTDCLARLDEAPAVSGSTNAIEAAIWFHDVVYDPHRTDNERLSAEWAGRALTAAGAPGPTISRVQELVVTTEHAGDPTDDAGRLLSDIDLSILGREPMAFDEYQRRIREEYAWVPEPDYRRGRARILTAFLDRPRLYFTDHFRDRYEPQARLNLRRALAELAS